MLIPDIKVLIRAIDHIARVTWEAGASFVVQNKFIWFVVFIGCLTLYVSKMLRNTCNI